MGIDLTSSQRLEIRLLGPFRASVDGRDVEAASWKRRKPLALVKLLALQRHHRLHREQVTDLLWPDLDPEAASNQLYKALHLARRAFEPDLAPRAESQFIVSRDQMIVLTAPGGVWIDADAFEELASTALRETTPAPGDVALSLYTDDLLAEDPYEDWPAARRESMRTLRTRLGHHVAAMHASSANVERAVEIYRTLVTADETDEPAHRALMRLFAGTGQRHLARRQFEECREAIRAELGAEPDAETVALAEAIQGGAFDEPVAPRTQATSLVTAEPVSIARVASDTRPVTPVQRRAPVSRFRSRRAVAALCCALVIVTVLLPFGASAGQLRHKLARFVAKAESIFDDDDSAPRLVSFRGRLDSAGARIEALESISGWATMTDADGRFLLLDVRWRPNAEYELLLTTERGATRVLTVTAPDAYPTNGVFDLGALALADAALVDVEDLYGVNSVSYLEFDVANTDYYRGVYDSVTTGIATDGDRIDALNRFVASRFTPRLEMPDDRTPRTTLAIGTPNSGALGITLATLCHAGGYVVRLVDMAEPYGERRSHMIAEVYYNGAWHAFDPSYGLAVRDDSGEVVSYEELRRDPALLSHNDYAAVSRPGWESRIIPELYVSGIHHLYAFRPTPLHPSQIRAGTGGDLMVPLSL